MSSLPENPEGAVVSKRFTTGDVSFHSNDGVLFRIDQWRLNLVSDGFPPLSCRSDGLEEIDEDSQTLEMLFAFAYPNLSIPDIGALPFDALVKLLNAADKYAFYSAIEICLCHLQKYAEVSPFEILQLAGRHNHRTLLVAVAPYVVNLPPEKLKSMGFHTDLCDQWKKYRDTWMSTLLSTSKEILHTHSRKDCGQWENRVHPYLMTRIDSPVGPIYRLIKGLNTQKQKGVWEIYQNVLFRLTADETLIEPNDSRWLCCKYDLQKWFHRVSDELKGIQL
ncbi:hypothetical protein EV360DRAFT_78996 [Lentinula raphanica]|nr:hypothetical protein EV360DRAFT_78996 [Lentinula raphanica]